VLPLGLGWSLWIHLFVQYPKTIGAVMLACALSSVPTKQIGLGTSDYSVARTVFCAVLEDASATVCERSSTPR
jgi:hypothetical protein